MQTAMLMYSAVPTVVCSCGHMLLITANTYDPHHAAFGCDLSVALYHCASSSDIRGSAWALLAHPLAHWSPS